MPGDDKTSKLNISEVDFDQEDYDQAYEEDLERELNPPPPEDTSSTEEDNSGKSPTDEDGEAGSGKGEETSPDDDDESGKPPSSDAGTDGEKGKGKETEEEPEEKTEEKGFQDEVIERLSRFEDEKSQKQFLADLDNYEKFRSSLTEKSKDLADKERELSTLSETLKTDEIKQALTDPDLIDALDEWYGGKDKNPFRNVPEIMEKLDKGEDAGGGEGLSELEQKEFELVLKEERLDLERNDESIKDDKVYNDLAEKAVENNVTIKTAYELFVKLPKLQQELADTVAELKERNKELSELKAKPPRKPRKTATGKAAVEEVESFDPKGKSWDDALDEAAAMLNN